MIHFFIALPHDLWIFTLNHVWPLSAVTVGAAAVGVVISRRLGGRRD